MPAFAVTVIVWLAPATAVNPAFRFHVTFPAPLVVCVSGSVVVMPVGSVSVTGAAADTLTVSATAKPPTCSVGVVTCVKCTGVPSTSASTTWLLSERASGRLFGLTFTDT